MVDAYGMDTGSLTPWPRVGPFGIYWFEDVLLDDLNELAALRPQIQPVLLCGGEHGDCAGLRAYRPAGGTGPVAARYHLVRWVDRGVASPNVARTPCHWCRIGARSGMHSPPAHGEDLAEKVMGQREALARRRATDEPQQDGRLALPEVQVSASK